MFFKIEHAISLKYTGPVFIEPFTVRLQPHSDCRQKLQDFSLTIDPPPQGKSESVDTDGNSSLCVWSLGMCDSMTIRAVSRVETLQSNPYNFILTEDDSLKLPVRYSKDLEKSLDPYLEREYSGADVNTFTKQILDESGANTVTFLNALNDHLCGKFEKTFRAEGDPMHPVELLKAGGGSCRDFAVLFMDSCRSLGLAARFTSGYFAGDFEDDQRHLHAWPEIYLPGGGWRGFDPVHGLAVADRHISVASAANPRLAAPTTGMYRGTGIDSSIDYEISIEEQEPQPQ